ncbi:MAG: acetolactate synthase [Rhizobiales bacterium]|nr:acetolactate synthase [Hyphomicrobiales bacterium]
MAASPPTCADAVVGTLQAHGLDRIYCVPGIQNDWFFNAVYDTGGAVTAVHTRHEQGAAYMALGAALATGRPSVYSVVPGPGVLNTAAALATAYSTNAPVLCLTGQIASRAIGRGMGLLHEIPDQLGILERLTKQARRSMDPARAASDLAGAIAALTQGRPRPVGLEIPPDVLAARGPFTPVMPTSNNEQPDIDAGLLDEAVALLSGSARPLIVVGGGAQGSSDGVRLMAERLQAPVLAYRMGRGVLDDRHPLSVTLPAGHRLWKSCDAVLIIGSRAQMPLANWGTDAAMKIVRIEVDPTALDTIAKPDVALVGRVEAILPRLVEAFDRTAPKRAARTDEIAALKAEVAREVASLDPQVPFLQAIRAAIGDDGILVDELTQCGYVARFAYPVHRPRTFISSGYQGTLGWGYATALGVQDVRRDVAVVSISGDGGFMFNVQELATAIRHDIPLIAVVFNDGAYGNVRRMQKELHGNRVIATDLANPDFVAMARSFGVDAERVQTPDALRAAVAAAAERRRPCLIEVPVGDMPSPWRFLDMPRIRGLA